MCFSFFPLPSFFFFLVVAKVRGVLREGDFEQNSPVKRMYQRLVEDWIY